MSVILLMFLAGFASMLVSIVGVLGAWGVVGKVVQRNLHYLVSFAAGVFFLVALDLTQETFSLVSVGVGGLIIAGGVIAFLIFAKFMPESHQHYDTGSGEPAYSKAFGRRILLADSVHNFVDGIVLVPAFMISVTTGIAVAVSILIHELIQEVSEFFVLRESGYSIKRALVLNFIVSGTILLGIVFGLLFSKIQGIEPILLGFAAGAFFYVVFADLVPHSFGGCKTKHGVLIHVAWALAGVALMYGVLVWTGVDHGRDRVELPQQYLADSIHKTSGVVGV